MRRARGIEALGLLFAFLLAAAVAHGEIAQQGKLRVTVDGELSPKTLPRTEASPISVSVAGRISTTDGSVPPQLKELRIEINRHGRFDFRGLPLCQRAQIQPASSAQALAACRASLVGQGKFSADVVLSGQEPYPTRGRLLVFNGRLGGRPALLGQIYSSSPFDTSFVIPFMVSESRGGTYGTVLTAPISQSLGNWGRLTGIEMKLSRSYTFRGARRSYVSASCPAPEGFRRAPFPLARTKFVFQGGRALTSTLNRTCGVRGG